MASSSWVSQNNEHAHAKKMIHGGLRSRNLPVRSQSPYPTRPRGQMIHSGLRSRNLLVRNQTPYPIRPYRHRFTSNFTVSSVTATPSHSPYGPFPRRHTTAWHVSTCFLARIIAFMHSHTHAEARRSEIGAFHHRVRGGRASISDRLFRCATTQKCQSHFAPTTAPTRAPPDALARAMQC